VGTMEASAATMSAPLVATPAQESMAPRPGGAHSAAALGQAPDPDLEDRCGPAPSKALMCLCSWNPMAWIGCVQKVDQNQQQAILYWGKYAGSLKDPGLYCLNPCGRQVMVASTKYSTLNLKDIKVVDAKGNPVIVSGVVTYALTSAKKACIDVEAPSNYVALQATAAMKQVASLYPYQAPPGQASLQAEGPAICAELMQSLQAKVAITGAHILNFEIVDLSYAPEVAQVMLVKQQAEALIDARRLIVGAAVDMSMQAVQQLEAKGANLSVEARERVASNLLTVICSHNPAVPTMALQGGS